MIFIWIIVSILIFSIIVLIHEFGHFSTARLFWVKVEEFGLGIPPRAKKIWTDKKWTLYSLNWLPLWGFVRLFWESSRNIKTWEEKQSLYHKPAWQQSIIILAGVFMNFILAGIIFSLLFFIWVKPIGINTKIETDLNVKIIPTYEQALQSGLLQKNHWLLLSPVEWSIAEKSGIKSNDIVLEINNMPISQPQDMIDIISKNIWKEIELLLKDNRKIDLIVGIDGKIWSYISENISINEDFEYKYWFFESLQYGFLETYNQTFLTFKWLWYLLKKISFPDTQQERDEAISQVSGPIGIVDFITSSLSGGFMFILILSAIISINLWVFNLLPIPALDGGRFVFILINSLSKTFFKWKKLNQNIENMTHVFFFLILIALSILIAYNDIIKIING